MIDYIKQQFENGNIWIYLTCVFAIISFVVCVLFCLFSAREKEAEEKLRKLKKEKYEMQIKSILGVDIIDDGLPDYIIENVFCGVKPEIIICENDRSGEYDDPFGEIINILGRRTISFKFEIKPKYAKELEENLKKIFGKYYTFKKPKGGGK